MNQHHTDTHNSHNYLINASTDQAATLAIMINKAHLAHSDALHAYQSARKHLAIYNRIKCKVRHTRGAEYNARISKAQYYWVERCKVASATLEQAGNKLTDLLDMKFEQDVSGGPCPALLERQAD